MNKAIITLLILFSISGTTMAKELKPLPLKQKDMSLFQKGVIQYKSGNYTSCLQIMSDIVEDDPGNATAHYYKAISNVKIGNNEEAMESYKNVISLNPDSQVGAYAQAGLTCIETPTKCKANAFQGTQGINNSLVLPVSEKVKQRIDAYRLNNVKEMLNTGKEVKSEEFEKFEDFSPQRSDASNPSEQDIAHALKVLQQAGMDPYANNMYQNPEMMQMTMLLNSMNGSNGKMNNTGMMNMMPMMMGQNGKKPDPQMMEAMIQSMMMPDMFSTMNGYDKKN